MKNCEKNIKYTPTKTILERISQIDFTRLYMSILEVIFSKSPLCEYFYQNTYVGSYPNTY